MKHKRIPALAETLRTGPLDIVPVSLPEALRLHFRIMARDDLRNPLIGPTPRPAGLRLFKRFRRPDGRKVFIHAIRLRDSGETLGWHMIRFSGYKSANLGIAMFREDDETRGMALMARRALIAHFFRHGDVLRFTGSVDTRNFASILLYKKLGFQESGILNHAFFDPETGRIGRRFIFDLMGEDLARLAKAEDDRN